MTHLSVLFCSVPHVVYTLCLILQYSMLHVTPPMGPLDVMMGSPISDTAGWVDVNKETMQHNQYSNVFALGDCSSVPTSKTAAAVAAESGVLKDTLFNVMRGKPAKKKVCCGVESDLCASPVIWQWGYRMHGGVFRYGIMQSGVLGMSLSTPRML